MGTSTEAKNKWNEKNYERLFVTIPKGYGQKFRDYCREKGISVNSAVSAELNRRMEVKE